MYFCRVYAATQLYSGSVEKMPLSATHINRTVYTFITGVHSFYFRSMSSRIKA